MCSTSSASPGEQEQAGQAHCVPVIQRTHNSCSNAPHHSIRELRENDRDIDSGYDREGEGWPEGEKTHTVVKK